MEDPVVLGQGLLFGKPSRAELFDKASQAKQSFFRKGEASYAICFQNRANQAFSFPKLSNFWLFSVNFYREYNFWVE